MIAPIFPLGPVRTVSDPSSTVGATSQQAQKLMLQEILLKHADAHHAIDWMHSTLVTPFHKEGTQLEAAFRTIAVSIVSEGEGHYTGCLPL